MIYDQNISLPVIEILKSTYFSVFKKFKAWLVFSYTLAIPIYFISKILPDHIIQQTDFDYVSLVFYMTISLLILVVLNIYIYRLFMLGTGELFKVSINELFYIIVKMTAYLIALFFVLFLAILTFLLLFGLIVSIVKAITGDTTLGEAILTTVINLIILIVILLISMRVQPTFISVALNKTLLPMKSAYYYTRDNNKKLILIGLLAFIPAILPSTASLMLIKNLTAEKEIIDLIAFLLFPLIFLPNVMVMGAGVEIYKLLVPNGSNETNKEGDFTA